MFYLSLIETDDGKNKFRLLHSEYEKIMKYIAMDVLGSDIRADEAVANALTILADSVNRGKIDDVYSEKTKGFVCIVTKNCALKLLKDKKKQYSIELEGELEYRDLSDRENVQLILEFIRSLPDKYRDVLELMVYYDMSFKDISKTLGIKEVTVRKRLERARKMLREILERNDIYVQ